MENRNPQFFNLIAEDVPTTRRLNGPRPSYEWWAEMASRLSEGLDHPVAPNRLELIFCLAVH